MVVLFESRRRGKLVASPLKLICGSNSLSGRFVLKRVLCAALIAAPGPALAAMPQMTVADLQTICAGNDAENNAACRFFILGVVEGASLGEGRQTVDGPLCIATASSSQLVTAIKIAMAADLKAFPQDRSLAAAGFVTAAAMKVFPCPKTQ
jgi:hypothetical protein